jgi:GT2 family glycosyltransferase
MIEPKTSVIVLTWNGIGYLESCLDSVLAQEYANLEIIVVDNGSNDGSPDFVARRYPQIRLIRNRRNLGFAAGSNIGLLAATGDVLVLLNQDTEVQPGWLVALVNTFADAEVGLVGCKLRYPDGTIQHAGGVLHGPRSESEHIGRHEPDRGQFDQFAEPDFVTAAALGISRSALATIGLLDHEFSPAYYEDTDWCYRARAAGLRVVYQPHAVGVHHESTTTDSSSLVQKFALNQGRLRFAFKHHPLDRLINEFLPAEVAWLAATDLSEDVMAAQRAYHNTMLKLPGISSFRQSSPEETKALRNLLMDLCSASLALVPHRQTVHEVPFTSQVPVLGKLLVAIRNLWNSVAAKWYVRPMIQQQNTFNAQVTNYLFLLSLDVAENHLKLTNLAERMAEMNSSSGVVAERPDAG